MARIPEENRELKCCSCGFTVDRDINAARNVLARGVRFASFQLKRWYRNP
jgi:transposase